MFDCEVCQRFFPFECIRIRPVYLRLEEAREREPEITDGAELIPCREDAMTRARLETMNEFELSERGLSLADKRELLSTGRTVVGGTSLCPRCFDDCFGKGKRRIKKRGPR